MATLPVRVMITSWSGFKYQLDESTSLVWNSSSALRRLELSDIVLRHAAVSAKD
jgi:hypothetical protein